MNLFIDTNIFLDFYHLSGADIEELHKLTALLEEGKIKLFMPQQLCEEFQRNRDNKIKDAMSEFKKASFKISFPAFSKLYPHYNELQELLKLANKKHAELYKNAMTDINSKALKADEVITELFSKAHIIETSNEIFSLAINRFRIGNPPGKKKVTIGDEINWECLLKEVPEKEDLYLVARDNDYSSPMDTDKFNAYLHHEWKKTKHSDVMFYKTLPDFFKENYPEIKLASDVKKSSLIESLAKSGTFASTHLAISKLSLIDNFSPDQVEQLIDIAEINNQVGWIIGDSDVKDFYKKLKIKYFDQISAESLDSLNTLLDDDEPETYEDVPF